MRAARGARIRLLFAAGYVMFQIRPGKRLTGRSLVGKWALRLDASAKHTAAARSSGPRLRQIPLLPIPLLGGGDAQLPGRLAIRGQDDRPDDGMITMTPRRLNWQEAGAAGLLQHGSTSIDDGDVAWTTNERHLMPDAVNQRAQTAAYCARAHDRYVRIRSRYRWVSTISDQRFMKPILSTA